MGAEFDTQHHIAVRRKGIIHVAALTLLGALLACSLVTGGSPAPATTSPPTATTASAGANSGQSAAIVGSTTTPTVTEQSTNKSSESLPASVKTTAELNVRTGPNTYCPQIGTFPKDTQVQVLAKDPSGEWWQVTYQDQVGWMSATYTTPVTDLSGVQAIPGPACDTPVCPICEIAAKRFR